MLPLPVDYQRLHELLIPFRVCLVTPRLGLFIFMHSMYYLKIHSIELIPAKYGTDIKITRIGMYNAIDNKFVKWVKLNDNTAQLLKNSIIPFALTDNGEIIPCNN